MDLARAKEMVRQQVEMERESEEIEDLVDEAYGWMELNSVAALTVGNLSDLDWKWLAVAGVLAELDDRVVKCIRKVKAWNRLFANVMDVTFKQQELAVLINKLKEDTVNYKVEMFAKQETLMPADVNHAVSQQADHLLQVIGRKDDEDRRCRDEERQLQMITKYDEDVCYKLMSEIEPADANTLSSYGPENVPEKSASNDPASLDADGHGYGQVCQDVIRGNIGERVSARDGLHDEAPGDVSYGAAEVNRYTVLLDQDSCKTSHKLGEKFSKHDQPEHAETMNAAGELVEFSKTDVGEFDDGYLDVGTKVKEHGGYDPGGGVTDYTAYGDAGHEDTDNCGGKDLDDSG
jgi:hypothetical protein